MRLVVQRVTRGRVTVGERVVGEISFGLVVLIGIAPGDGDKEVAWAADKITTLRIFEDEDGKMNLPLIDTDGAVLLVSQFTLYGDARKGRRPSFIRAATGDEARAVYGSVAAAIRSSGARCETGEFGASMDVELVNSGPITILLDSDKAF